LSYVGKSFLVAGLGIAPRPKDYEPFMHCTLPRVIKEQFTF